MKALIPAAGHGTRFLPASMTVPKEMLPVGAKPAIQLIVEEALAAGADEVVVVTSPDKPSIRRHFDVDAVWHARCANKPEIERELVRLEDIGRRIVWVEQTQQRGLGHAVLQAAGVLAGEREPVLVLLGDALVSGEAPSAAMAAISRAYGGASVVGLEEVPAEKVSRYGIVSGRRVDSSEAAVAGGVYRLDDLVEKPSPEEAPSRLAIAGRYLLDPAVFSLLASQTPGHGGEIQLTDAIRRLLSDHAVYGYQYPGRRHDIGNPRGYFETLVAFDSAGGQT